jgi:hypothetical protein
MIVWSDATKGGAVVVEAIVVVAPAGRAARSNRRADDEPAECSLPWSVVSPWGIIDVRSVAAMS